jgi:hypothetical protein
VLVQKNTTKCQNSLFLKGGGPEPGATRRWPAPCYNYRDLPSAESDFPVPDPPTPANTSHAEVPSTPRGKRRPRRLRAAPRPPLTIPRILAWADDHQERTGRWPGNESGTVLANRDETWKAIALALLRGGRGLERSGTLAQLLARERGVRNKRGLPPLTEAGIVVWAEEHQHRTGAWPTEDAGPVTAAPGEVWSNVDAALRIGGRGLPRGDSLARLLARNRGVWNRAATPPLMIGEILRWADSHFERTQSWPTTRSGPVMEAAQEDWQRIDEALRLGHRGLPGGSSLARLLAQQRGARNAVSPPRLTLEQIVAWADEHRERTGAWPTQNSGPVASVPHENWTNIDSALRKGRRGLPAGGSVPRLLADRRGKRHPRQLPRLTIDHIVGWAKQHHSRTGAWPSQSSGAVADAPEETWAAINAALRLGIRGLRSGDSLARLLDRRCREKHNGR